YFSYSLGKILINAHKNWYKGGYIKFWFDLYKLKKEYKNKGKK
ncbi:TPA: sugar transferase, partial [Campylobacter jejuni]